MTSLLFPIKIIGVDDFANQEADATAAVVLI